LGFSVGSLLFSSLFRSKRQQRSLAVPSKADRSRVCSVVLTGGPCGGKSTGMAVIRKDLESSGYLVFTVPEVPTILISNGCSYPGNDAGRALLEFEGGLISLQLQIEESFARIAASTGKRCVLLLDRGLVDVAAYLPAEQWAAILKDNGLEESECAGRYDAVLHLQSAAAGAEDFYTTANNAARTETVEEARDLDVRILENWRRARGKGGVLVAENGGRSFDEKVTSALEMAKREVEKKFK